MYDFAASKIHPKRDFQYNGFQCHFFWHQAVMKSAWDVFILSRQLYS